MTVRETHIFITGATGYIGGTILTRLLQHPKSDSFRITAIVRNPDRAERLRTLGVKVVLGSHDDEAKLAEGAEHANVVITAADVDDLRAAKAVLAGIKRRHEKTGEVPILIHTSGTATLCDNASGQYASQTVYSDISTSQIESLPPTQLHREVDLAVIDADLNQKFVRSYIILPSTIWGIAQGPLVDLGIQNPHSQQIPNMIKVGLQRGQGASVGEGKNLWPNVNIRELSDLYILIFDSALSASSSELSKAWHGREGYYFGATDEHTLSDVYETVARALYDLGKTKSPEPMPLSHEEILKYFGSEVVATTVMGGNSRCKADRSRALGWAPKLGTKEMLESIPLEVQALITQGN